MESNRHRGDPEFRELMDFLDYVIFVLENPKITVPQGMVAFLREVEVRIRMSDFRPDGNKVQKLIKKEARYKDTLARTKRKDVPKEK